MAHLGGNIKRGETEGNLVSKGDPCNRERESRTIRSTLTCKQLGERYGNEDV